MNRKQFGNSGLLVTPIGLGMAALGRPGYINLGHAEDLAHDYDIDAMERHAHDVLDAAWSAGVRYYDAARSYGRAEAFLGSWLASRQISPTDVAIGSKWGYIYTADWQVEADKHEIKDHRLPVLNRQIRESRELLGKYLNLYQIHSATLESGVLDNLPVLDALADLRRDGLTIGLSLSGPKQAETLRRALTTQPDGVPLFGSVQATWNILAQEVGPALKEAHQSGMGVILKEVLANGRLTTRNQDPSFRDAYGLLVEMATELETTVDALAMAAAMAQPWADIVLSGAARVEHLRSNLQAGHIDLNSNQLARLLHLKEPADVYWELRGRLEWN
jgi:aryl-alcohol dehydrogenase-like predicted oxidoreductase